MSVRRRNINQRLGRDLQYERGLHEMTRGLLKASQDLVGKALAERDEVRERLERFRALAFELAKYFTEPPATLSRDSDLFLMLQELTPLSIPVLPATPKDVLEAALWAAGVTVEQVAEYAHSLTDSITEVKS
jgi:hypothetical protein